MRAALVKDGKSAKALLRVADAVDLKIRDAGFDPFKYVLLEGCLCVFC